MDKKTLSNLKSHFMTVTAHRHEVLRHCIKAGIPLQGLTHDLSKFSPEEFINGVKYYQGTRSPHEGEREAYGFSYAWMCHKGRNKHHFEYWWDYDPETRKPAPVKMPLKLLMLLRPIRSSARLSSGWKTTITAISPTCTVFLRM